MPNRLVSNNLLLDMPVVNLQDNQLSREVLEDNVGWAGGVPKFFCRLTLPDSRIDFSWVLHRSCSGLNVVPAFFYAESM